MTNSKFNLSFGTATALVAVSVTLFGYLAWQIVVSTNQSPIATEVPLLFEIGLNFSSVTAANAAEFDELIIQANDAVKAKVMAARSLAIGQRGFDWFALGIVSLITLIGAVSGARKKQIPKSEMEQETSHGLATYTLIAILGAVAGVSQTVSDRLGERVETNVEQAKTIYAASSEARANFADSSSSEMAYQAVTSLKNVLIESIQ